MKKKQGRKNLKSEVISLLQENCRAGCKKRLESHPARKVINPLFSLLHSTDEIIRWRSVSAMGMVMGDLFDKDPESARIIMRRLIWNLNDESGGIGWGSPEAMGEIMAVSTPMATEYHRMLLSYVRPDGNFLEHPMLQRGVLWGIARLGGANPEYLKGLHPLFLPYMETGDPQLKWLAVLCAVTSGMTDKNGFPDPVVNGHTTLKIYTTWDFETVETENIMAGLFSI